MSAAQTVVVGRIGRAHGLRGEVSIEPHTDEPDRRFADGNALTGRPPAGASRTLTIEASRRHQGKLLVRFAEVGDRTAAEQLRGTWLDAYVDPAEAPADPEEFYDHQLIGLRVEDIEGVRLGQVTAIEHSGGQDLLHLEIAGAEVLYPFVAALVPVVDVPGGRVVVDDRPGLLTEALEGS